MQNDLKMYTKVCAECGAEFETDRPRARLCDRCRTRCERERYDREFKAMKKPKPQRVASYNVLPLRKFVILLDRYNRQHRTRYTYGQAQQHLADGVICKKEFYS